MSLSFRRPFFLFSSLIPVLLVVLPGLALAQTTHNWDGNGSVTGAGATPTGTWGSSTFWNVRVDGRSIPTNATTAANDTLNFSAGTDATGAYTVTVSGTRNAGQINIQEGAPTFSGGTIALGIGATATPGIVVAAGAGNPIFSSNLSITGTQTFNVGTGRTLTLITGTFTRNAGAMLTVTGLGSVTSTMTNLSANNAAGIIGPWLTVGTGTSTRYGTFSGSTITALTGTAAATAADLADTTGLMNYDLGATGGTMQDSFSGNTVRYTGGAGTLTLSGTSYSVNGILNAGTGALTLASGTITIGADKELVVHGTNTNYGITIGSIIQDNAGGASGLTKAGTNTLTLTGANTYTGTTTVTAGTLSLTNNLALQNSALNTAGAGAVTLGTTTPTFGGLQGGTALATAISSGYGSVTALTLNPGIGISTTYSGAIADGVAGMTLTKTGAGTQTLAGTLTYTGATTVSAGTLNINGSLASSAVTVGAGGTLGGSGTFGAGVTVSSGGTLAPGNSPGLLTFGSGLTLASGSTTIFEINGLTRGTTHDGINVTGGTLTYGGTLTLTFGGTVANGATLDLFSTAGATVAGGSNFAYVTATGSYNGSFTQDNGTWTFSEGGQHLTFESGTGDLTVIPEPSTYAALCGALALGLAAYRRRAQRATRVGER